MPDIVRMMNNMSCLTNKYNVTAGNRRSNTRYIVCSCNRVTRKSNASKYDTFTSGAETSDTKCNFQLSIKYDDLHNQWYMRQNAGHCLEHRGHLPIEKEKKEVRKENIDKSVLKDAGDLLMKNVPKSIIKELVELKTGLKMSYQSLAKIKNTMMINLYKTKQNESIADTLLSMMEKDNEIEWVAYYGTYSVAEKAVCVRKRSSKAKRKTKDQSVKSMEEQARTTEDGTNHLDFSNNDEG